MVCGVVRGAPRSFLSATTLIAVRAACLDDAASVAPWVVALSMARDAITLLIRARHGLIEVQRDTGHWSGAGRAG